MHRLALLLLLTAHVAEARELVEYGELIPARASLELVPQTCELDVELHGAIATGELRERIANPGPHRLAASLDFELPRGAVVTGFALGSDSALSVAAGFQTSRADDIVGPDPAVLVATGDDRYRATVQPIAPGKDALLVTRWSALAQIRDGTVRLALPGHASCKVTLHATPGPGTTIGKLEVAGAVVAGPKATFTLGASETVVAARLGFGTREQPLLWQASESLGDGWTATVATVIAPPHHATGTGAHRVLFVIDVSRSMELIGRQHIAKIVDAVGATLPEGSEVEAILFDRTAKRVIGSWAPIGQASLGQIDAAIAAHAIGNGSDIVAALELAHTAIADGARSGTMVVAITDGVFGELADTALPKALQGTTSSVDFHAIVLDPGPTRSPGIELLGRPVALYGGSIVEVGVDELDLALGRVESWLRPAWMDVKLDNSPVAIDVQLPAGGGSSVAFVTDGPAPKLLLTNKTNELRVAATAVAQPIAVLALADAGSDAFEPHGDVSDSARLRSDKARARSRRAHPAADDAHAFAVLASAGKVATDRRAMVKGGGPYARLVAIADGAPPPEPAAPKVSVAASAISLDTLQRLFRDQLQPRAYVCYQRALGVNPKLVGTVYFELRLGRGEVADAQIVGIGDPKLDACLLDAAYSMMPPLPDWDVNSDDQTIAKYPLTFNLRESRPIIILGDADSESPLDIDAIEGGVPTRTVRRPVKVDTASPLGKMRPSKN